MQAYDSVSLCLVTLNDGLATDYSMFIVLQTKLSLKYH